MPKSTTIETSLQIIWIQLEKPEGVDIKAVG